MALARDLPDIAYVVSDISLTGEGTGLDLRAALSATNHPAKIVLMTSLPETHPHHAAARTSGIVLRKPFDARDLAAALGSEVSA